MSPATSPTPPSLLRLCGWNRTVSSVALDRGSSQSASGRDQPGSQPVGDQTGDRPTAPCTPPKNAFRTIQVGGGSCCSRSVGAIERPPDPQRLIDLILRGVATDQHVHLIGPLAEHDVRRSAAAGEAVEARPLHRY